MRFSSRPRPSISSATVRILEASGVKFEWETFQAGAEAFEKYHEYIPKELTQSIGWFVGVWLMLPNDLTIRQ